MSGINFICNLKKIQEKLSNIFCLKNVTFFLASGLSLCFAISFWNSLSKNLFMQATFVLVAIVLEFSKILSIRSAGDSFRSRSYFRGSIFFSSFLIFMVVSVMTSCGQLMSFVLDEHHEAKAQESRIQALLELSEDQKNRIKDLKAWIRAEPNKKSSHRFKNNLRESLERAQSDLIEIQKKIIQEKNINVSDSPIMAISRGVSDFFGFSIEFSIKLGCIFLALLLDLIIALCSMLQGESSSNSFVLDEKPSKIKKGPKIRVSNPKKVPDIEAMMPLEDFLEFSLEDEPDTGKTNVLEYTSLKKLVESGKCPPNVRGIKSAMRVGCKKASSLLDRLKSEGVVVRVKNRYSLSIAV
ncbi:MAG: hypothetical protein ACKOAD_06540 [Gammaproteobacteria bacterium]